MDRKSEQDLVLLTTMKGAVLGQRPSLERLVGQESLTKDGPISSQNLALRQTVPVHTCIQISATSNTA